MAEKIAETLRMTDFDQINSSNDLLRIDLEDELVSLIEEVLRRKGKDRVTLETEFDIRFTRYKEQVAVLKALAHWSPNELQELTEHTLLLARDLKVRKNEIDRLDRLIEELDEYLDRLESK